MKHNDRFEQWEVQGERVMLRPWQCEGDSLATSDLDAFVNLFDALPDDFGANEAPRKRRWADQWDYYCDPADLLALGVGMNNRRDEALVAIEKSHLAMRMFRQFDYQQHIDGDIYRAVVCEGEPVGIIWVGRDYGNRHIDGNLGCLIHPVHRKKGIGTEAVALMVQGLFVHTDLTRLSVSVYAPDKASIRVLEKNGFTHEGTIRKAALHNDEPVDILVYGKLRE